MSRLVTRRSVVKLAYSAPVVVASMRLTRPRVLAQDICRRECTGSPVPTGCVGTVGVRCDPAAFIPFCDDAGLCAFVETIEGDVCCADRRGCGPACVDTADCQTWMSGSLCQAPGTGCCGQVCIPPCGAESPDDGMPNEPPRP